MADVLTHTAGVGLWDNEAITTEWKQARAILGIGDTEYRRIMQIVEEDVDKSSEFIDIIT
jgi:hypothetical protein